MTSAKATRFNPSTHTKMKTQHTPGPWIAGGRTKFSQTIPVRTNDINICDVFGTALSDMPGHPMNKTQTANARLIASAPDLLAALESCSFTLEAMRDNDPDVSALVDQARAAIAKATGGVS